MTLINPVKIGVKEAILTWRLEKNLSKRRILELYLNVAEWGEGIFGIESAARHYYGISAADLSADQAAHLAAVLPNPERFKADKPGRYVRRRTGTLVSRQHQVVRDALDWCLK